MSTRQRRTCTPTQARLQADRPRVRAATQTVDHSAGEYVRGDVITNQAEGFFSQLKRSIDGTHHHVSREHLDRYLAEFDFRYSTCKETDTERMQRLLGQIRGRRLCLTVHLLEIESRLR